MEKLIDRIREFLVSKIKNPSITKILNKVLTYEVILYLFFGVVTTIVDYVVYTLLIGPLHMDPRFANVISQICAIIVAYLTNRVWVFKSTATGFKKIAYEAFKFGMARLSTLIMSEIIIFISVFIFGKDNLLANNIAKIISMVLTILFNYIFSKLFIFKSSKEENE